MKGYKRLSWYNRVQIESWYNAGMPVREIAEKMHRHVSGIYYELKFGFYEHLNSDYTTEKRYSAYKAQQHAEFEATSKGPNLKIGNDFELLRYIEQKILKDKMSPDAVLGEIREKGLKFKTTICTTTLYHYIDQGLFQRLTNKDLPEKAKRKKKKKVRPIKRSGSGRSIEQRDPEILFRDEFGHWELDTVIGKRHKDEVLFVFTERKTRMEWIFKAKDKSAVSCVRILNRLERKYRKQFPKIFQSITVDNGAEFSAWEQMETSCLYRNKRRTTVYFCHPFASCERGSNENQNRFIRRFVPKSTAISSYSDDFIRQVQDFINNYPRRILAYASSQELFDSEMKKIFQLFSK